MCQKRLDGRKARKSKVYAGGETRKGHRGRVYDEKRAHTHNCATFSSTVIRPSRSSTLSSTEAVGSLYTGVEPSAFSARELTFASLPSTNTQWAQSRREAVTKGSRHRIIFLSARSGRGSENWDPQRKTWLVRSSPLYIPHFPPPCAAMKRQVPWLSFENSQVTESRPWQATYSSKPPRKVRQCVRWRS